jgi:hypothetical protein
MDRMQATPRNAFIGGLADLLAAGTSPRRTQQMRGLMEFLQVPDIAQTLDRVSYGEPLTTGAGMTTKLRPEAENTLMAAMGMIPAGRPAEAGAMALGRAGERMAERVVPQVMERGGLPAEMLSAMAQGTQSPATVFHGSPHLFPRFDSSKIGTGEGAQAYGQGLYLAQARDVGKSYAPRDPAFEQKLLGAYKNAERSNDYASMQVLEEFMTHRTPSEVQETLGQFSGKDAASAKRTFDMASKAFQNQKGSYLYQVDLPDEQIAQMLDYDKPLSQQPQAIQDFALRNAPELVKAVRFQQANPLNENFAPKNIYDLSGREMYSALQSTERKQRELFKQRDALVAKYQGKNMSMADAVRAMNADDRAQFSQIADQVEALKNAPAAASSMLRQAGIPGIRYLDEGSRGAGKGTSNFVVFPGMEDMLRIEQINEQPIDQLIKQGLIGQF